MKYYYDISFQINKNCECYLDIPFQIDIFYPTIRAFDLYNSDAFNRLSKSVSVTINHDGERAHNLGSHLLTNNMCALLQCRKYHPINYSNVNSNKEIANKSKTFSF